jgi:FMN reductase
MPGGKGDVHIRSSSDSRGDLVSSEGLEVVALNGSPSATSKTHAVAALGLEIAGSGTIVDLGELDAAGLLGRSESADVEAAKAAVRSAQILLLVTPIYRATYSGLLKVLFDQLGQAALRNTACVLAATGGSDHHYLSVDTGLRPLVASLEGTSAPTAVYLTGQDFDEENSVLESGRARLETAMREAIAIASVLTKE